MELVSCQNFSPQNFETALYLFEKLSIRVWYLYHNVDAQCVVGVEVDMSQFLAIVLTHILINSGQLHCKNQLT